jgi:glycosyltransferase involved in cell wall biosynthesis
MTDSLQPLFSIGVTTFDRVEMLIETINSVLAQTFTDYEVIVSNDNPHRILTSESLGIVDPRVRFVNQPKNLGELYNMQFLLKSSRGKYFTWLADDDLYHPDFFLSVQKTLIKYNFPPCVFTSFDFVDKEGGIRTQHFADADGMLIRGPDFLRQYLSGKIKAIGVMGFFDRDYLRNIGGLEDVSCDGKGMLSEYMLLLKTSAFDRIAYINAPLIFYRSHENAWCIKNTDAEMYRRAAENLIRKSIDILKMPALRGSFYFNFSFILKLCFNTYFAKLRKSGGLTIKVILSYSYEVWKYISSIRGSLLYIVAIMSLMKVEAKIIMGVVKRRILAKDI